MVLRKCPHCKEKHYSADTTDRNWLCRSCGAVLGKDLEEPATVKETT